MVPYKYGNFGENQVKDELKKIQGKIYFLILLVDPDTSKNYLDSDVNQAFRNLFFEINGLNSLLNYPVNIVSTLSLLESALIEYNKDGFNTDDFRHCDYRKLVFDAGKEILKYKEV